MFLRNKISIHFTRSLRAAALAATLALALSGCTRDRDAKMWNSIDYGTITRPDNDSEYTAPASNCLEEDIPDPSCN